MQVSDDLAGRAAPPAGGAAPALRRADAVLAALLAWAASLLVVAEIAVLFAGVLARYVFQRPLIWTDELASILFLWLAMLGAVIALQRGEHMRMTAIVGKLEPRARAFLDLVAIAAGVAFLAFVVHPAYEFAQDEVFVTTPAMGIVNTWRAAALPISRMPALCSRRWAASPGSGRRVPARCRNCATS